MDEVVAKMMPMLVEKLGTLIVVFIIWYLTHVSEQKKWEKTRLDDSVKQEADAKERERDRVEHMQKWHDMIKAQGDQFDQIMKSHAAENERSFKLYDRMASAIELVGGHTARIADLVRTNQFCPKIREAQGE